MKFHPRLLQFTSIFAEDGIGDLRQRKIIPYLCNRPHDNDVLTIISKTLISMIQNYLRVAIRNLRKHFTYSIINVVGLGLGLATCLLLLTWIRHELSYDRFHTKADQIFRASVEYSFGGQTSKTSVSPTALLPTLQKNFQEVENGVRVYNPSAWNPYIVRMDDKLFQEGKFYFADSTFFKIFSFLMIKGNPENALTEPRSVILTETTARKYFGDLDPMGRVLQVNNKNDYTVTGLMKDVPGNCLLQFDFLASFSSLDAAREQIWWSANYQTFFLLSPGADVHQLSKKTNELVKKELASELTNPGDYVKYNFMRLTDIYLRSEMDESEAVGSIQYVYIFSAIAFLVLIIACINYINLATAKAADRAKEVGVRKIVGAVKKQLLFQFMGESVVITLMSFAVAFLLALLTLPLFNSLTGKQFLSSIFLDPILLGISLLGVAVIALIAGAYPAFAITSFKPANIIRGNFRASGKGIWLRRSLVVFQFCVSIILVIGTIVILKQVNFIQNKRLGYEKENVLVLSLDSKTREVYDQLRTEWLKSGKAAYVGRATESPTKIAGGYGIKVEGNGSDIGMVTTAMDVDTEFIPAMGMEMIKGRNFTEGDAKKVLSDTLYSFVLNEAALKELSIDQEKAVGTKVNLSGRQGEIIGVVKDFHFASFHEKIRPLVLFNEGVQLNYIFIKLNPGDLNSTLAGFKKICTEVTPHRPFEYKFLDEQYQGLYSNEQRMGRICSVFATLTIIIACLGLLGLVAFAASQKTKEIGIRKVLGASVASIVVLITRDYTRLVIIAILLALPLAYFTMEAYWLSSFAYKTSMGVWPFISASIGGVVIAFGTATFQALKAAFINPAETLRSE